MGGRGTYAQGINKPYGKYEVKGEIDGFKILKGIDGHHKLPEESANSKGYVRLDENDNFKEMRIYDENHQIKLAVAYHPEPKLTGDVYKKVLHAHDYTKGDFKTRTTRFLTKKEIKKYKKLLQELKI